jgi:hypothetical protein
MRRRYADPAGSPECAGMSAMGRAGRLEPPHGTTSVLPQSKLRMSDEWICGEQHEKDLCRCDDDRRVCTAGGARSRARRRRSAGCVVGSRRFGPDRGRSRCCGRLHGGAIYRSFMGTQEIQPPSHGETIQKPSFQAGSARAGTSHGRSRQGEFGTTRPSLDAVSPCPKRDATRPDAGMTDRRPTGSPALRG